MVNDLFFFGRPVPEAEKIARIQAVSMERIRAYLATHPRDRRCVQTVGPRPLAAEPAGRVAAARR
jgi:hypothetical protein